MSNVTIQKRGKYYQYKFETAKIDGKRKFASKYRLANYFFLKLHFCVKLNKPIK